MSKFNIFFHNWWNGFFDCSDANNINFFKELFNHTKFNNYNITNNIDDADIIVEAGKPNDELKNKKNIKYKINFIGEPVLPDLDKYDIVFTGMLNKQNVIDLPVSIMYILGNNILPEFNRNNIQEIPPYFCCFIVSNPKSNARNKMFDMLNSYKRVNSAGNYKNNIGRPLGCSWHSQNHINYIKNHKFMICFENTKLENYSTEKIVNAFRGNTIPIYYGPKNIGDIFNINAMLILEDESEESYDKLIKQIIELDTNDKKYLDFINQPIFTDKNLLYWNNNYSYEQLGKKINNIIDNNSIKNMNVSIPENCTHIKLDIGLSYSAPISNKFLVREPDVYVMGFEPNPHCFSMIKNGTMPTTRYPDFNLEQRFIESGRFQIFPYALSNVEKEESMDFFINLLDYGTSSLFSHNQTKLGPIKEKVSVQVINLKMVLDKIPWDRFEYIDYIKIDAQGSDLNILKGAGNYLSERVVYVTAEPDGHYYNGAEDCSENNLDKFMESKGFTKIDHPNTVDPTYINSKFLHLKDKIWIHQCGPWP